MPIVKERMPRMLLCVDFDRPESNYSFFEDKKQSGIIILGEVDILTY